MSRLLADFCRSFVAWGRTAFGRYHFGCPTNSVRRGRFGLTIAVLQLSSLDAAARGFQEFLGTVAVAQDDINGVPQWVDLLERQPLRVPGAPCATEAEERPPCDYGIDRRRVEAFRALPALRQLQAVNRYVNGRRYVRDLDNYGREDFWATPSLFLANGGDCEDFAIVKLFLLQRLGWPMEDLRLVIVQDTRRRVSHAVLAVAHGADVWVLDNQSDRIVQEQAVSHYVPVYSVSDRRWWLHLPPDRAAARLRAKQRFGLASPALAAAASD